MNMKKLLAAGLIASVAMASAEANNDCVNGGFFIQGGFGISTTKMKYKNDLKPQINALIAEEFANMIMVEIRARAGNAGNYNPDPTSPVVRGYAAWDINAHSAGMDATKTSLNKRKNLFQFEFGAGIDKRIGSVMLGIAVNFGKNCGNVKKREKGVAYKTYLIQTQLNNAYPIANIPGLTLGVDQNPLGGGGPLPIPHQVVDANIPTGNAASGYLPNAAATIAAGNSFVFLESDIDSNKLYQRDLEMEFKCKNKYYVSIMPRFGILVNPRLELFVTAGVKIKSDKYTIYVPSLKKSGKKTVTKCIPAVGLGLQYNFHNGMFANLSYTFNFKAKKTFKFKANNQIGMDTTVKHTLQNSSHDIKLGFGYRF